MVKVGKHQFIGNKIPSLLWDLNLGIKEGTYIWAWEFPNKANSSLTASGIPSRSLGLLLPFPRNNFSAILAFSNAVFSKCSVIKLKI